MNNTYPYNHDTKHISFVSNNMENLKKFKGNVSPNYADVNASTSIRELFPLISSSSYHADLIIFDVENIIDLTDSNIVETFNTISTLLSYTVCKKDNSRPVKRTTNLAAYVSSTIDTKVLKKLLKTSIIGIIQYGDTVSNEENNRAINELLKEKRYIPENIKSLLTHNKKLETSKSISKIELTPRQEEILTLIRERGCSNKVISKILNISESTVKLHVGAVLKKYNLKTRTQLAIFSDS
jgi:DNA-binding NarL/FixJ family response regulator